MLKLSDFVKGILKIDALCWLYYRTLGRALFTIKFAWRVAGGGKTHMKNLRFFSYA